MKEATFDQDGLLKKADLDSVVDYIASTYQYLDGRQETFTPAEQLYIKDIIQQRIDSHFKKHSKIILLPADLVINSDSIVTGQYSKGTVWIKNSKLANPGSICTTIKNGKIIGSDINLHSVYGNERAIVQEGLSARIAPNEVGFKSKILPSQTVLHKNTTQAFMQPADDALIKLAQTYAFNTPYNSFLVIGNLAPAYNALKAKQ